MHQLHARGRWTTSSTRPPALGIRNILALRGDPPAPGAGFERPEGGFDYAYQLIDVLKARAGEFAIGCAGFPEGHPDCAEGRAVDWGRLRDKIEHGAEFVLTQLFFDNADYFAMVDHLTGALGVTVPITPGVLPILSTRQIKRFTALCGATLPPALVADLDRLGDDDEAVTEVRHRVRVPAVRGAPRRRGAGTPPLRPQSFALYPRHPPQPRAGVGRLRRRAASRRTPSARAAGTGQERPEPAAGQFGRRIR